MSLKDRIVSKLRCLSVLPPSALYLAGAELFMDSSVVFNWELLRASLHTKVANDATTIINISMGFGYALILTFVLDINWAAVVLAMFAVLTGLLTEWSDKETISAECLTAAFAISWTLAAVQPLRMAFIAEQIPKTVKTSYSRGYFAFIAACGMLSKSCYWIYVSMSDYENNVRDASIMFFCVTLLYMVLIIQTERSTRYERRYFKAPYHINKVSHEKGQKQWDVYHIAMTLSAQTFAILMTMAARSGQYRAVLYEHDVFLGDMALYGAFPGFVGVFVIVIALVLVEPGLKHLGVKVTDLKYVGAGMVFGCISLGFSAIMQRSLDKALRPPNRNEGLLLIFNTLPSTTSFRSGLFDKNQRTWLQVPSHSETSFYATDIIGKREYAVSISNPDADIWDEDFMRLEDGKLTAYVIANRKMTEVKGLNITHDAITNKGKVYVGCSLKMCMGNIYFHQSNRVEVVSLPENDKFTVHHLKEGSYKITTFVLSEREFTVMKNFTIKNSDIVAGLVVEDEGDVNFLPYNIRHSRTIPLHLLILQDIFAALRDSLFGVGVLRFLFIQTNANNPSRQFTYSAFFLIFRGLPWMVFGGIQFTVFAFDSFLMNVYLLYYGCCTVLFWYSAYKFDRKWVEIEDE